MEGESVLSGLTGSWSNKCVYVRVRVHFCVPFIAVLEM